ncbi:16S rRNA (uracil(1498)-N(3))-methyltransferase [Sphingomonas sp. RG327]|uniref:Ribosomal RNA small subunit methyltransferase E n=1 Tax=Sphingomonas anseongensis TaxID=2908207 RepID=A0ABT0RHX6_9SPHN|nr:16S rRNA (uracil(1498)-N(3))-methyltransferase [Sphingomonas anseongensis]MCL6679856.1 16S rRNA (uracil(1498)-N(3))-methyltransferase [Sphingomonas anseongensis]
MPATPAWPPKSLPRLFIPQPLAEAAKVELDQAQANYLGNVLRLGEGSELLVFDGESGEWLARISDASRKRMTLAVERQTRGPETVPDLWLAFAPVKRTQTDWLVEKATELGAARLVPVITERTIVDRVKLERLKSIAIEAAEQCGRTRLPELGQPLPLARFLEQRAADRTLYFADETGGDPAGSAFAPGPAAILTGPEGGFTTAERNLIRSQPRAIPISLGPRILRAETAVLAAVTIYMALAGDWR